MNNKIYYQTEYKSPLGDISICCDEQENIVGLWFNGQKYFCNINGKIIRKDKLKIFNITKNWLDKYFKGENPDIKNIPLKLIGTDFQKKVWTILHKIPYGTTTTYGNIAKQIAKQNNITKMSAQAVGGAVGHNPIAIIIPCHRVIGKNGKLTGYAAGIDKKQKLLELEQTNI